MPLLELLGDADEGFELAEDRQSLAASWRRLSDTERQILGLRLLHGLTQREISQRVGYSHCVVVWNTPRMQPAFCQLAAGGYGAWHEGGWRLTPLAFEHITVTAGGRSC